MNERKKDHLEISINEDVNASYNYWDDIEFVHNALPEIDMDEVDTTWEEFGKKMAAPIIIAGMTGGFEAAKEVNEELAKIAEKFQIGMGVGSQRAALEDESSVESYSAINNYNIPLKIANIGAPQLLEWKDAVEKASKAIDMIEADVLAIHLNFLQEAIQVEGDRNAKGCLDKIQEVASSLSTPVIVKETGAGISKEVALRLCETDIAGIDVGGMSGTSFAAIEAYRAKKMGDSVQEELGYLFKDWGIPTPVSVMEVADVCHDAGMVIIATGGIRNGIDAAKAIAIGADAAGMASAFVEDGEKKMEVVLKARKMVMCLTGCKNVRELKEAEIWIS
ncbi:MAG: type 2 isopentenyl-diphosphate Delta-isomerase [Thermoplasmata archaeon]|nr:MAG: type 2 isopentenyl-diphosphate Delta-isomerase [Thermoplasmata archaeon]